MHFCWRMCSWPRYSNVLLNKYLFKISGISCELQNYSSSFWYAIKCREKYIRVDKNIYNFMNVFYLWSFCTKSIILPKSFSLQTYFKIIHTKSRNESCFYRINVGLHIGRKSNIFCLVAKKLPSYFQGFQRTLQISF